MQERLLQILSLDEQFHDARIVDKLKRTRVQLVEEHVGNVSCGVVAEEHDIC
jgi:hypothetical protein